MHHVCAVPTEVKRGCHSPGAGVKMGVGVLGTAPVASVQAASALT